MAGDDLGNAADFIRVVLHAYLLDGLGG
jgi:hypothetical protein